MIKRLLLLLCCIPIIAGAQTEVKLGIRSTFAERIPLWLNPFEYSNQEIRSISQQLEELVNADLEFSGLFHITRGLPSRTEGKKGNLEIVVRGILESSGENNSFEGRVIDASNGQMIGGRRYRLKERMTRRIAHHFSDEIVRLLTGEKGIASTRITFVRKVGESWELVLSDYDGYNPRVIMRLGRPIINPRWVEDSEAIVYTSYLHGKPDLFIRRIKENTSKPLSSFPGLNYSVDWSERRNQLAVTLSKDGNPEIYLMNTQGKIKRRLTHNRAIDCSPSWSPSGREIIFVSDRSGNPQLYLMEADGSNVRRLTFQGNYNASPAWSPKGDLIAFVTRLDGYFQLCTVRPDGSDLRVHTTDLTNHDSPRWAVDGRHIAYSVEGVGGSLISVVDITTNGKRILSKGENPDWSSH